MTSTFFVQGPPGTGKTTYLSRQCRLAVEARSPSSVAIASLTRAAAAEIGGRDLGIEDHQVGTLHAHAYRALDRPQLAETPEGIRAWNDTHPHQSISRGTHQLEDAADQGGGDGAGDSVHHQVMTLRARMIPRENWTVEQRAHDADWEDFKRQTKRLDFTDLIEKAIAAGEPHPALPTVLLLDEAQDFSRLELQLAGLWARHTGPNGTTIIVADPDQALYSWRGADPQHLQAIAYTGTRVLSQSHRVPAAVHQLALGWVRQITDRVDVSYQPTSDAGDVGSQNVAIRSPETLFPLIRDLTEQQGKTVMLITSCGYMLTPLIHALRRHGIPFHNPYRLNDGRWNPMRTAGRLKAFLRADERVWGQQARCWTWDDLRLWTDPMTAKGVLTRGAKTLIESKCTEDRFGESQAQDEVDLDTLGRLFADQDQALRAMRGDVDWWAANLRAKEKPTSDYPLAVLAAGGHAALATDPKVIVGTIHSVKGGEADVVIVAPDLSVTGYWQGWHPGGPQRDQIVRMMYVALTRARERVILLAPSGPEHVDLAAHAEVGEAIAA